MFFFPRFFVPDLQRLLGPSLRDVGSPLLPWLIDAFSLSLSLSEPLFLESFLCFLISLSVETVSPFDYSISGFSGPPTILLHLFSSPLFSLDFFSIFSARVVGADAARFLPGVRRSSSAAPAMTTTVKLRHTGGVMTRPL